VLQAGLGYKALDTSVAAVPGWDDYRPSMPDEELLGRLLALNLEHWAVSRAIDCRSNVGGPGEL